MPQTYKYQHRKEKIAIMLDVSLPTALIKSN